MYIDVIENCLNWTIPRTNSSLTYFYVIWTILTHKIFAQVGSIPNEVEMLVVDHGVLILGAQLLYIYIGETPCTLCLTPPTTTRSLALLAPFQHHRSLPTTQAPSKLL